MPEHYLFDCEISSWIDCFDKKQYFQRIRVIKINTEYYVSLRNYSRNYLLKNGVCLNVEEFIWFIDKLNDSILNTKDQSDGIYKSEDRKLSFSKYGFIHTLKLFNQLKGRRFEFDNETRNVILNKSTDIITLMEKINK
jgi:hypothetical protein